MATVIAIQVLFRVFSWKNICVVHRYVRVPLKYNGLDQNGKCQTGGLVTNHVQRQLFQNPRGIAPMEKA